MVLCVIAVRVVRWGTSAFGYYMGHLVLSIIDIYSSAFSAALFRIFVAGYLVLGSNSMGAQAELENAFR